MKSFANFGAVTVTWVGMKWHRFVETSTIVQTESFPRGVGGKPVMKSHAIV